MVSSTQKKMDASDKYQGFELSILSNASEKISENLNLFGILTTLELMGESTHLSKLALLLGGMAKSTLSGYLDDLINHRPALLEIDNKRTSNKRGAKKYYRLTKFGQVSLNYKKRTYETIMSENSLSWLTNYSKQEYEEAVKNEAMSTLQRLGESNMLQGFAIGGEINRNLERMSASLYVKMAKDLTNHKQVDNIQFGKFYSRFTQIKLSRMEHILQLQKLLLSFNNELDDLAMKFQLDIDTDIEKGVLDEREVGINSIYLSAIPIILS